MKTFEDLDVYRRSLDALVEVHKIIRLFPDYEKYDLSSQLRRASYSVPCNIAEGYGRKRFPNDLKRFLSIAEGSANEVVVQLEIALRLGYADREILFAIQEEYRIVGRQLNVMIAKWK